LDASSGSATGRTSQPRDCLKDPEAGRPSEAMDDGLSNHRAEGSCCSDCQHYLHLFKGATCCRETGGAAGRRAWGRVAGETAGGRMRGVRACVHGRVDWCGDGVGRRERLADWLPPLRRCPAEAPAGEAQVPWRCRRFEEGVRPVFSVCGEGEHMCICVGADAPRPSVHPLGRVWCVSACARMLTCAGACRHSVMYACKCLHLPRRYPINTSSAFHACHRSCCSDCQHYLYLFKGSPHPRDQANFQNYSKSEACAFMTDKFCQNLSHF
jgi:hypothetical protein